MGSRLHLILGHAHKVFVLGKPLTVATVWGCTGGGATRDSTAPLDKRGFFVAEERCESQRCKCLQQV